MGGEVSFSTIIALMSKLVPILQDSNLVFNDAGYVELVFTEAQRVIMEAPEPPAVQPRVRQRRQPRRYLCGYCRQEGHNRMRCPVKRQHELEQNNNNNAEEIVVVENIFAQQPREVIEIE